MSRPLQQVMEDIATLRCIVEQLKEEASATGDVAMVQHISQQTASRLMECLHRAGIIEHPTHIGTVRGKSQRIESREWRLTRAYLRGDWARITAPPKRINSSIRSSTRAECLWTNFREVQA